MFGIGRRVFSGQTVAVVAALTMVAAACAEVRVIPADLEPLAVRSTILARDGTPIAHLYEENRRALSPEDIPRTVRDAVIAAEDANFERHPGIDASAIMRAARATWEGDLQGGSTITQQLAKLRLGADEPRTIERKIREAIIAMQLEREHSKDELLAMYLDSAYFGARAYGVVAAAETYFGKSLDRLSLGEVALLVGLLHAPTKLNPYENLEGALRRRSYVLSRMHQEHLISARRAERADRARVRLRPPSDRVRAAPAFVQWVEETLLSDPALGETERERAATLARTGLRIRTTLDLRMQRAAERAVASMPAGEDSPDVALIALDPRTGAVRAMIGGRDFRFGDLNLAVRAERHPGSAFKPLALAAATEHGIPPWTLYDSAQGGLAWSSHPADRWRVRNYDGRDRGLMSLTDAMVWSVNAAFARLAIDVGPEAIVDVARRLGISADMEPYPSLALGAMPRGVSPLEMASAYGTFAAYGRYAPPHGIRSVEAADGSVVIDAPEGRSIPALDPGVAHVVNETLQDVMLRGTGRGAWIGRPAAGKTGTSERHADAWFVGYTPDLVAAVWIGHRESRRPMGAIGGLRMTGGSWPARIWRAFMLDALADRAPMSFAPPAHALVEVWVDEAATCLTAPGAGEARLLPPTLIPSTPCPPPPDAEEATPDPDEERTPDEPVEETEDGPADGP